MKSEEDIGFKVAGELERKASKRASRARDENLYGMGYRGGLLPVRRSICGISTVILVGYTKFSAWRKVAPREQWTSEIESKRINAEEQFDNKLSGLIHCA